MKLQPLEKHITRLASMQETKKQVISCYLNLDGDNLNWRTVVPKRETEILNSITSSSVKSHIRLAFSSIKQWLNTDLEPSSRGAAIFVREGGDVFVPMQFSIPLPTEITIDTVPHLYNLVRMSDSFHQYIVLYSDSRDARIYEVNLGEISERMLFERPDVRSRLGREWTKLHYQRQHRERDRQFLQQKLDVLDRLFTEDPRAHLILAGTSTYINQIASALPQRIASRLVDQITLTKSNSVERILLETLQAYVKAEERESLNTVDRLLGAFQREDLAVLGVAESLKATLIGQADTLVLSHGFDIGPAYICPACDWIAAGEPRPNVCAECGAESLMDRDARQELVRLAHATRCEVETVAESEKLLKAGGAGCLLRYADALTDQHRSQGISQGNKGLDIS